MTRVIIPLLVPFGARRRCRHACACAPCVLVCYFFFIMKSAIGYDLITGLVGIYLAPVSAENCQLIAALVRVENAQTSHRRLPLCRAPLASNISRYAKCTHRFRESPKVCSRLHHNRELHSGITPVRILHRGIPQHLSQKLYSA